MSDYPPGSQVYPREIEAFEGLYRGAEEGARGIPCQEA